MKDVLGKRVTPLELLYRLRGLSWDEAERLGTPPPSPPPEPRERSPMARRTDDIRQWARSKVNNGLAQGKIERPDVCEECGEAPPLRPNGRSSIEGHHEDYEQPLQVRWLCVDCHQRANAVTAVT